MSADERYVIDLHRGGHTRGEGALYAIGRLAVFAPHGSPLTLDADLRACNRRSSKAASPASRSPTRSTPRTAGRPGRFSIASACGSVSSRRWCSARTRRRPCSSRRQVRARAASCRSRSRRHRTSLASARLRAYRGVALAPEAAHGARGPRGAGRGGVYDYVQHAARAGQTLARFGFALPRGSEPVMEWMPSGCRSSLPAGPSPSCCRRASPSPGGSPRPVYGTPLGRGTAGAAAGPSPDGAGLLPARGHGRHLDRRADGSSRDRRDTRLQLHGPRAGVPPLQPAVRRSADPARARSIDPDVREAALCCGMTRGRRCCASSFRWLGPACFLRRC